MQLLSGWLEAEPQQPKSGKKMHAANHLWPHHLAPIRLSLTQSAWLGLGQLALDCLTLKLAASLWDCFAPVALRVESLMHVRTNWRASAGAGAAADDC